MLTDGLKCETIDAGVRWHLPGGWMIDNCKRPYHLPGREYNVIRVHSSWGADMKKIAVLRKVEPFVAPLVVACARKIVNDKHPRQFEHGLRGRAELLEGMMAVVTSISQAVDTRVHLDMRLITVEGANALASVGVDNIVALVYEQFGS